MKRIQCLIFGIVFFFFINGQINAQQDLLNQKVNNDFKNITVRKALKQIEQQLSCYFTYESSTINNQKKITLSIKNTPLKTALDKILKDTSLVYKVIDNHIVIRKKEIVQKRTEIPDTIPKFTEIRGKIIDQTSGAAISDSEVSILGYSIGVISNAQGEFILKIPEKYYNEQFCISHVSYKNLCFPIAEFRDTNSVFALEWSYNSIQEIVIRKTTDARSLIKSALKKIKENYSNEPMYLNCFYRESVKRRGEFMFYSEAVLQVYKSSYTSEYETDMAKVLKARKMNNISAEDTVSVKLKSGLYACFGLDVVKNPVNFLDEENFYLYDYNMTDIVSYNDRNAYLIEFKQKESVYEALYMGKLYIDIKGLAIIGAEFYLNPAKINKAGSSYIAKKDRGIKIRMNSVEYKVSYRLVDSVYILSHVRGELKMKVRKRKKIFPTNFETCFELAVSEVDTIDVKKFKRRETENLHSIFFNNIYVYDESFWEHYNFIKPNEPLLETIRRYGLKN